MAVVVPEALADPVEVARVLGTDPDTDRVVLATLTASQYVAGRTGYALADVPLGASPYGPVRVVEAPAAVRQATVAAAIRFYKGPDVPFGLAGADLQSYVRSVMPEVDLALLGYRVDFGVG